MGKFKKKANKIINVPETGELIEQIKTVLEDKDETISSLRQYIQELQTRDPKEPRPTDEKFGFSVSNEEYSKIREWVKEKKVKEFSIYYVFSPVPGLGYTGEVRGEDESGRQVIFEFAHL